MREPIFNVAFCPSEARICGFCSSLVLESLISRFNVACGMLTAKLVALMFLKVLSVRPLLFVAGVVAIPLLFVPLPLLLLFVTVWFGVVNWMPIGPFAVGGCSPRSRIFC